MKKKTSLILFMVVLVLAGCSTASTNSVSLAPTVTVIPPTATPEPIQGPRISFTSDYADWGQVPFDTQIKQVYEFKNVGSDVLEITDMPTIKALEGC